MDISNVEKPNIFKESSSCVIKIERCDAIPFLITHLLCSYDDQVRPSRLFLKFSLCCAIWLSSMFHSSSDWSVLIVLFIAANLWSTNQVRISSFRFANIFGVAKLSKTVNTQNLIVGDQISASFVSLKPPKILPKLNFLLFQKWRMQNIKFHRWSQFFCGIDDEMNQKIC